MGNYSMHGLVRAADQKLTSPPQEGRCILHLDMDAYFAAVEQRDLPIYRGVPLVVCHTSSDFCIHGVVATASYEARQWGIKAGMSVWEARSLCPHAHFVHANIPKYLYNTRRIVKLCERYTSRTEVFSIDEVFLDLTPRVGNNGWEHSLHLARELKEDLKKELGLTASVGLGPNKLVAKMASEFRKPDGLTLIRPEQLPDLLSPLPVDRLVGVGSRMLRQMRSLGIERIGDLAQTPAKLLERRFGIMGRVLHLAAQGKDYSPVGGGYEENLIKSFGHSLSLRGGSNDLEALSNTLLGLVDAVARRMRKEGYLGRTVILRLRVGYSRGYARAATLGKYTCLPRPIFQVARSLLEREALSGAWEDKITTVGVSVSQLKKAEEGRQLSIWDYLDPREHQLISALDKLYDKYGEGVVTRASLLGTFSLSGMNPAIP